MYHTQETVQSFTGATGYLGLQLQTTVASLQQKRIPLLEHLVSKLKFGHISHMFRKDVGRRPI